jgi:hypothetical protein
MANPSVAGKSWPAEAALLLQLSLWMVQDSLLSWCQSGGSLLSLVIK